MTSWTVICLFMLSFLSVVVLGCTASLFIGPQVPSRSGLLIVLRHFETNAKWQNWSLMLEMYYLSDHVDEMKRSYSNNLKNWFRANKVTASLISSATGPTRHFCVLALRFKRLSPRYDPHYVVYYRVQKDSCQEQPNSPSRVLAEGRMEWGFEIKQQRWIHLRALH